MSATSMQAAAPLLPAPRRLSRRAIFGIAIAVAAAGAIAAGVRYRSRAASKPSAKYETARIDRGRIVARVTATGTLSAIVTVQVGSQVSGRIQELFVDFNSMVKRGQVIARIDPAMFAAAVESAAANVDAARGNLVKARALADDAVRQRERTRALRAAKLVAQADLDSAEAGAEAALAQVAALEGSLEQARAALAQTRINLAYTTIVSPTDGVVISRNVDVGQTVAASLQAPTLFVIAEDLRKMQVDTNVAEGDVGRLTPGMAASFAVDAYPGERFQGVVRQIRNAPQTIQNVVTYDAVIDVANDDLALKPGMTANVTFVFGEKADVLRVPNAALRFRPQPGFGAAAPEKRLDSPDRRTVWVLRSGAPQPIALRIGISDGTVTEVVEGDVRPGDEVVTDAEGAPSSVPPALRRGL